MTINAVLPLPTKGLHWITGLLYLLQFFLSTYVFYHHGETEKCHRSHDTGRDFDYEIKIKYTSRRWYLNAFTVTWLQLQLYPPNMQLLYGFEQIGFEFQQL